MKTFSFIYLLINILLFFLMGCGPREVNDEKFDEETPGLTDTTRNIKTEVDNTDTDSLYEGY